MHSEDQTTPILEALSRYELRLREERRPDGSSVHLAWYAEAPGCLVESDTREGALAELQALIVGFLADIMKVAGILPIPLSERPRPTVTHTVRMGPAIIGDVGVLRAAKSISENQTTDLTEPARHFAVAMS